MLILFLCSLEYFIVPKFVLRLAQRALQNFCESSALSPPHPLMAHSLEQRDTQARPATHMALSSAHYRRQHFCGASSNKVPATRYVKLTLRLFEKLQRFVLNPVCPVTLSAGPVSNCVNWAAAVEFFFLPPVSTYISLFVLITFYVKVSTTRCDLRVTLNPHTHIHTPTYDAHSHCFFLVKITRKGGENAKQKNMKLSLRVPAKCATGGKKNTHNDQQKRE